MPLSLRHKRIADTKIAIIGAGAVGATIAYTLVVKTLAAEVILIDVNEAKREGEIMDLDDGQCFSETGCVRAGSFKDARNADIIVLTAGAAQKPGETRLDLVNKNKAITTSIFKSIGKIKPTAIIVVVANPVDIITYMAQELSGLPRAQVFGTGTALDTARLRTELAHSLGVYAHNVSGFMLGEHGDSEFAAWSTVTVGGMPLKQFNFTATDLKNIETRVKTAAYEIINRKGATYYGIAMAVADILEAILFDQHKIVPLSVRLTNWNGVSGVCLGVPAVLGRSGVEKLWPLELAAEERKKFKKSAEMVKKFL
jgi:L-lactate dehydrogenase